MTRTILLAILWTLLFAGPASAAPDPDPRILVDATVNGKPVKLWFDTGCDLDLVLFRKTVERVEEWDAYALSSADVVLCIMCPGEGGRLQRVFFDTGMEATLLSRSRWRALHRECPDLPTTLSGGYSPAAGGTFVSKVTLAPTLSLGRLKFDRLIVQESAFVSEQFAGHEVVLGMRALGRFDIVIDTRGSTVYLRPREGPFKVPDYNRLGAVFVPKTLEDDALIAHVLPDSPAARAGLKSGDVLLAVDGRDYTVWRKNPQLLTRDRVAEHPAGTRHVFTVCRGERVIEATVTLEDILTLPDRVGAVK